MSATSMAAALAATLPVAPTSSPAPSAPADESLPASMSKVVDIEAEIPTTTIQLDGLVSDQCRVRMSSRISNIDAL
jgi:translation initiation factor 3 subunit H